MIKLPVRASESVDCILNADGDVVIHLSIERAANGGSDFPATKATRNEVIRTLNGYGEAVKACEYAHAFLVEWKDTLANNQMTNEYYEEMSGEKELALVIDRSQQ